MEAIGLTIFHSGSIFTISKIMAISSSSRLWSLIIIGLILLTIIAYVIAMFECYRNKTFIFSTFTPSPPPNSFYPLGQITPLTQEEIETRNELIRGSV